jgi:hypothetical protein
MWPSLRGYIFERDYETAFNAFNQAFALSPSSALAFGLSSLIRARSGDARRLSSTPSKRCASALSIR